MHRTTAPAPRRWLLSLAGLVAVSAAATVAWSIAQASAAEPPHQHLAPSAGADSVPLYSNLGAHSWRVTTGSPRAQQFFNQGLRLAWGFNHAEAIRAFAEAERLDPTCAMCAWGVAWALGPNINAPMDSASGVLAFHAVTRAQGRAATAAPAERAVIAALTARYAPVPPVNRSALDSAYARRMHEVATAFPEAEEVQVLAADAVMNLAPWDYWNADTSPKPETAAMLRRLERVMAANPDNPGACHLYIHAVEKFFPALALPCAERLASLMPGAGHIVHMPGHIYIRVGRYADAIRANEHAVHADESYIRDQRPGVGMYTAGYYPHNYDFLAFAASMLGRQRQSIEAAEKIAALIPAGVLGAPGMGYAQSHLTRHLQMKVRFGQWKAILLADEPAKSLTHANALWVYARGRALAATGDVAGARQMLSRLRASAASARQLPLRMEFNTSEAILAVATEVLAGYTAVASRDVDAAVAHLRAAVRLEDALTYGEPPEWSIPTRQDLGTVLLQAGRKAQAAAAFREDLERFPQNVWSLAGLEQATGTSPASPPDSLLVSGAHNSDADNDSASLVASIEARSGSMRDSARVARSKVPRVRPGEGRSLRARAD